MGITTQRFALPGTSRGARPARIHIQLIRVGAGRGQRSIAGGSGLAGEKRQDRRRSEGARVEGIGPGTARRRGGARLCGRDEPGLALKEFPAQHPGRSVFGKGSPERGPGRSERSQPGIPESCATIVSTEASSLTPVILRR